MLYNCVYRHLTSQHCFSRGHCCYHRIQVRVLLARSL
ncbi:TPA: hypothetical protein I8271_002063 [Kluyvera intermedia]|uniref:P-type domain-containing protein n=1 Tax=Kluyvera intermedia TaxID=61648 RepID=A0A9P3T6X7_KLUIN|nr:hypothetical protein [Kluyvera intermedia]HAT2515572.1 hypothetical protein [Kluyvera intermedia]HAT2603329.1 hypothetical protein [Kluyvera intermedia]HAT2680316.1 hypothetical protein [Kluyvera intermedia]HAT2696717.1 hypothetical protein [Kluyvera intermedia]